MAWDLATAKTRQGLAPADTSKNVALQSTMDEVLSTVENLLGRGLLKRQETVVFHDVDTRSLRLPRYPVERIVAINGKAPNSDVCLRGRVGAIDLNAGHYWAWNAALNCHTTKIEYIGGFSPLPSDLERALWEAFDTLWAVSNQTVGGPSAGAGGGASVVQGSGDVSRVTLSDFGSVSFDVGATVSGGGGVASAAGDALIYGWLSPWAFVLNTYRSEAAPSLAFA